MQWNPLILDGRRVGRYYTSKGNLDIFNRKGVDTNLERDGHYMAAYLSCYHTSANGHNLLK